VQSSKWARQDLPIMRSPRMGLERWKIRHGRSIHVMRSRTATADMSAIAAFKLVRKVKRHAPALGDHPTAIQQPAKASRPAARVPPEVEA